MLEKRPLSSHWVIKISFAIALAVFLLSGCAKRLPEPESLFADYPGPQIGVTPTEIRLGISTLRSTQIVIVGTGFKPGDSVFVDMLGEEKEGETLKIPIDTPEVDDTGRFVFKVMKDVKTKGILRCDIDPTDMTPIVVRDPIPTGTYFLKATSVNSDRRAECMIKVVPPKGMDKLKDKFGKWFGRIRYER
jgi:hypothetical protein